jgi:hypothetical protein
VTKANVYDGEARLCRECGKPLTFSEWMRNPRVVPPDFTEQSLWVCDRCRYPQPRDGCCTCCGEPLTLAERSRPPLRVTEKEHVMLLGAEPMPPRWNCDRCRAILSQSPPPQPGEQDEQPAKLPEEPHRH